MFNFEWIYLLKYGWEDIYLSYVGERDEKVLVVLDGWDALLPRSLPVSLEGYVDRHGVRDVTDRRPLAVNLYNSVPRKWV